MKHRVAVTGAKGTIGSVVTAGLSDYEVVSLDLPGVDLRNYDTALNSFRGCEAVIHLAWNTTDDNWNTGKVDTGNVAMAYNVYDAALKAGVRRVVAASSVHADNFMVWDRKSLMTTSMVPTPTSPYGANKVFLEALGRYYAQKGLEVVCIRFGSVSRKDDPRMPPNDWSKEWLSHRDLLGLMQACLKSPLPPDRYVLLYGVSNNAHREHDWSNPLGWVPKDDSSVAFPL